MRRPGKETSKPRFPRGLLPAFPRKEHSSEGCERHVTRESNDPDHCNRRVDVVKVSVTRLLTDEISDPRHRANHLSHDEVRPRPTEQDSHVRVDIANCRGNDDSADELEP